MTAAFTGHRPEKISGYSASPLETEHRIRRALAAAVEQVAAEGVDEFLCGMAPGVDLWAADEVLRLRNEAVIVPHTRLTAVIPFRGFARSFTPAQRALYDKILAASDTVIYVAEHYAHECYNRRNDFLVDHADTVIAYWEGRSGGTQYTVEHSRRLGRQVISLFEGELF